MGQFFLVLVPILIVFISLSSAWIIKRNIKHVIMDLDRKLENVNSVNEAIFAKELLRFFAQSNASQSAVALSNSINEEECDSSIHSLVSNASGDVERLYLTLKQSLNPRLEFSKVSYISSFIPIVILLYGVILAIATSATYGLSLGIMSLRYFPVSVGIVIGTTLLFTSVIVFLLLEFVKHTGMIKTAIKLDDVLSR